MHHNDTGVSFLLQNFTKDGDKNQSKELGEKKERILPSGYHLMPLFF